MGFDLALKKYFDDCLSIVLFVHSFDILCSITNISVQGTYYTDICTAYPESL